MLTTGETGAKASQGEKHVGGLRAPHSPALRHDIALPQEGRSMSPDFQPFPTSPACNLAEILLP